MRMKFNKIFWSAPTCIGRRYKMTTCLIITLNFNFATTNTTSSPGSDKTNFATSRSTPLDGGSFTNVLMVTTSVGMLNGVHGYTSDNWPAVTLSLVLVVGTSSLQDGLVDTSTTSNNTYRENRNRLRIGLEKIKTKNILICSVTASS